MGGTLFLCVLFGGPLEGALLKPALWLRPAFASGTNTIIWGPLRLYIGGPLLGGILAAFLFMGFKGGLKIHLVASQPPPAQPAALPEPSTSPRPTPTMSRTRAPPVIDAPSRAPPAQAARIGATFSE